MRVTLDQAYYPAYGATLTAAYMHSIVDNAQLTDFHVADFTDISLAANPYMMTNGQEVYRTQASVISLAGTFWPQLLAKANLHYYAGSAGYTPVKGLPAFVPCDGLDAYGSWSAWTTYSVANAWYLPRISLSQRWNYDYFHRQSYASGVGLGVLFGVVGSTKAESNGIVPLVMYGMTQALVHATLSNELSLPGTVYEIYHDLSTRLMWPRSQSPTEWSQYTATSWPMGICRHVYTESGITLVNLRTENMTGASLAPYYVADVFLGGFPCL